MILVQQENFAAALEPARIANEKSPNPRESWLQLLASIQFQLADYPALADTLRRLVAVAPGQKRYWVQLATIENSIGKENEALASISIAHEAGLLAEDKEVRQRARMCFVRELPDCCVKTLEDGLAAGIVKPDAEAYRLLANCRIAGRDIDGALEPLAKAGELGDGSRSWLLLGQLQLQREEFDGARSALTKARAGVSPDQRASVELLLGIALLGSKDWTEAEKAFKVAAADAKTKPAADSYLRHLEQQRALQQAKEASTTAGTGSDGPVSLAAPQRTAGSM
jgi:tetratricopeptide (TPR) repeat protein